MQLAPAGEKRGRGVSRAIDITQYYRVSKSVGNHVVDRARIISIRCITKDRVFSVAFLFLPASRFTSAIKKAAATHSCDAVDGRGFILEFIS